MELLLLKHLPAIDYFSKSNQKVRPEVKGPQRIGHVSCPPLLSKLRKSATNHVLHSHQFGPTPEADVGRDGHESVNR
eukprot:scaffold1706_cov116-Cylindrotheca_fusiformis.AAC.16